MKITLQELNVSFKALQEFSKIKLPVKIAYIVARIVEACEAEAKRLQARVNKLIMEFGEVDEKNNYQVKPNTEGMVKFQIAYNELMEIEFDFWGDKIPFKLIEDLDIQVDGETLMLLDWMFEFEEINNKGEEVK